METNLSTLRSLIERKSHNAQKRMAEYQADVDRFRPAKDHNPNFARSLTLLANAEADYVMAQAFLGMGPQRPISDEDLGR